MVQKVSPKGVLQVDQSVAQTIDQLVENSDMHWAVPKADQLVV